MKRNEVLIFDIGYVSSEPVEVSLLFLSFILYVFLPQHPLWKHIF